jgi:hypothetical protein
VTKYEFWRERERNIRAAFREVRTLYPSVLRVHVSKKKTNGKKRPTY